MSIRKKLTTIASMVVIGLAGCAKDQYYVGNPDYRSQIPNIDSEDVQRLPPLPTEFWDWTQQERIKYIKVMAKVYVLSQDRENKKHLK